MNPDECKQALLAGVEKVGPILNPIGFMFEISGVGVSSGGPFASGFYSKGEKGIGLIYRSGPGLGAVIYEYDQLGILHTDLMKHLGKSDVSMLKYSARKFASFSREKENVFEALAYDIQNFALEFLNSNDAEFKSIIQQISSSKKAIGDRKRSVRNLTRAVLGGIFYGVLVGGVISGIFESLFLGILVGFGIALIVILFALRNEKRKK